VIHTAEQKLNRLEMYNITRVRIKKKHTCKISDYNLWPDFGVVHTFGWPKQGIQRILKVFGLKSTPYVALLQFFKG